MPMNFPDFPSLVRHAEMWKFRAPEPNESEEHFRKALADFVEPHDFIESMEIRNKVGWDKWDDAQNLDMIIRKLSKPKL